MPNKLEDTRILKRLKEGDMLAFDEIYHRYSLRLYRFVLKLIKLEQDAEEIVQEVFVQIWKSRDKIDTYSSFDSFLFTIAYNNTMSLLRKRVNERKYLDHLSKIQTLTDTFDVIDEINFKEIQTKYYSILDKLSSRQKQVYLLSRENGLSYKEIADKLNISVNTVEIHMSKALKFIKSSLGNTLVINLLFIYLFV